MSYDLYLQDPVTKETLRAKVFGVTIDLSSNITCNYAKTLYRVLGEQGIRRLYGKTGAETIPLLMEAIAQLKDDTDDDYWKECDGNVKRTLCWLLAMAQTRPDGVWDGD